MRMTLAGLMVAAVALPLAGCSTSDEPAVLNDERAAVWNRVVASHGALRAMHHENQTGATVSLGELVPRDHVYAVGALADLAGEVTIVDGDVYLSYPQGLGATRVEVSRESEAGATLLVASEVPRWSSVTTERAISFGELDAEIARLAQAAGVDVTQRFPFLVRGEFVDLTWHVIDGSRLPDGETTREDHVEAAVVRTLARTRGTLVGFFSESDQGIFTHMDSTTHVHCVLEDRLAAGHVDHVTVPAGTTVEFPLLRVE